MNDFMRSLLAGFLSVKISEYVAAKEYEKRAKKAEERRQKRQRIKGLEDVLTEEEKQILMDMD